MPERHCRSSVWPNQSTLLVGQTEELGDNNAAKSTEHSEEGPPSRGHWAYCPRCSILRKSGACDLTDRNPVAKSQNTMKRNGNGFGTNMSCNGSGRCWRNRNGTELPFVVAAFRLLRPIGCRLVGIQTLQLSFFTDAGMESTYGSYHARNGRNTIDLGVFLGCCIHFLFSLERLAMQHSISQKPLREFSNQLENAHNCFLRLAEDDRVLGRKRPFEIRA